MWWLYKTPGQRKKGKYVAVTKTKIEITVLFGIYQYDEDTGYLMSGTIHLCIEIHNWKTTRSTNMLIYKCISCDDH